MKLMSKRIPARGSTLTHLLFYPVGLAAFTVWLLHDKDIYNMALPNHHSRISALESKVLEQEVKLDQAWKHIYNAISKHDSTISTFESKILELEVKLADVMRKVEPK